MVNGNNDNVNVSKTNNFNDIDNGKYKKGRQVEMLADRLIQKLSASENSRAFFCKVGYKLPEATIWNNVESALKGRNPMGLFIYLCKRDMDGR